MNTKASVVLKVAALIMLYFALFMVSSGVVAGGAEPPSQDQMGQIFSVTLLITTVNVVTSALVIRSSRQHGWKLAGTVAAALYGVATLLSAIELVYYAPALGHSYRDIMGILPVILIPNLILFAIFMPIAVRVLGKWRAGDEAALPRRTPYSARQWVAKLAAGGVIYYLLYILFGFFVAWRNPELRAMYGSAADNTALMVWGVIPLQLFRGLLWVAFTLPVIRAARIGSWQLGLLVGLLCSLPMSIPLFMPNELLPDASARLSHFYEITASNFVFGLTLVWLFSRSHHSVRDLFGLDPDAAARERNAARPAAAVGSGNR